MTRPDCIQALAAAIAAIRLDHPTRVAIDGADGVGKTVLADELVEPIRRAGREVLRASIDGFHNPRSVRYRRGPDSPEGYFRDSFDYSALRSELLDPLGPGGHRRFRTAVFDYRSDRGVENPLRTAGAGDSLLFDGVFLLRPELEGCWDFCVWVEAPFDVTVERAIGRDASGRADRETMRARYRRRYVPGQRIYMEECRPRERADVVVTNTDFSHPELTWRSRRSLRTREATP